MLPSSYIAQPELIHVGEFGWGGGFSDVSKGEYGRCPVAIKHLRIGAKDEFDKIFKVGDCVWPGTSKLLSSNPAALPGSSHLETVISSECPAPAGGFRVKEPPTFPHHL